MKKHELEQWLRKELSGLPKGEVDGILFFYTSAIEDRMEDGMSEEEAVSALGDLSAILSEIRANRPMTYSPSRPPKRKKRAMWIAGAALLAVGVLTAVASTIAIVTGMNPIRFILRRDTSVYAVDVAQIYEGGHEASYYESEPDMVDSHWAAESLEGVPFSREEKAEGSLYYQYHIQADYVKSIYLTVNGSVRIQQSSGPYVDVCFLYPNEYYLDISDGRFVISQWDDDDWPDPQDEPEVVIFYPNESLCELSVEINTGDLMVTGLSAQQLFAYANTGSVALERVRSSEVIQVMTNTGSVTLDDVVSDSQLIIHTDTGSVHMTGADAMEAMTFTSITGSVTGTLAGPFSRYCGQATIGTGKCNLPASFGAGPVWLYVEVNTGMIDLSFTDQGQARQSIPREQPAIAAVAAKDTMVSRDIQAAQVTQLYEASASFSPPSPPSPPDAPALSDWLLGGRLGSWMPWNR